MKPQTPTSTLTQMRTNSVTVLDNETCVYCGTVLNAVEATEDHVIGRRFIPKGKLHGQWNLIIGACKQCNGRKSSLENDISAITLQADGRGRFAETDSKLAVEAARKAWGSVSQRTGKLVKDSFEQVKIKTLAAPGLEIDFSMTSPPQTDSNRIFELSRLQLMAFFFWVTYNPTTKRGGYWLGDFMPVLEASRSDWGNCVHRTFMQTVANWEPRILAISADGYFKVAIRKHPEAPCWSWALEWNQKYRIVGFFGAQDPAAKLAKTFPKLKAVKIAQSGNDWVAYRIEIPLKDEDDKLFYWKIN